ncbi:MAG: hypothetical protein PHG60_01685 [Candidatus Dojkabacteria bacterium]|jgi:hypothetical protein|nr:hypothetical protein [Candidatus Dojkabacteria bacterium]MDD2270273.1 hypothetical protein [Candidatus Dojkabacteria bacterium]
MARIRFKKLKVNWKQFFNYVLLILLSSGILLTFLIALPLTERLSDIQAFDLNIADEFWSKEYILDLKSEENSDIRKTKSVLFKRLNDYGVEEVSIYQEDSQLRVVVEATKPQDYVEELIRNPYRYSIVTRKEEIDFEDEENQLAPYLEENYDETLFDTKVFRNIYITELPNSSGGKSYFGIAKLWPGKLGEFKSFLQEYKEKYVGVNIDGFVTPVYIPDDTIFAIPLSDDKGRIEIMDILYNSGNIPISYELKEQKDLEVKRLSMDYIQITIALFVSIIAIYLYLYFSKTYSADLILRSLFTTLLSLAIFLLVLKIRALPIHTFIILIDAVILIALTNIVQQNDESRISVSVVALIIATIFSILGIGYLKILGSHLMLLSATAFLSVEIGNLYIDKVSNYLKK